MGTWGTTSATVGDITFKGAASTGTSLTIGAALSVGAVSTAAATAGTFTITLNDSTTIGTTMTGGAGIDIFTGTGGADVISTGAAADTLDGGSGDDTLTDAAGASSASGGAGADTISMGAGADTITGGVGADTITTGTGSDDLVMVIADAGDTISDFTTAEDDIDYNTALKNITGNAIASFQSAAAGTAIADATTIFELTGVTTANGTAAQVVTALGTTATGADNVASADRLLIVSYTAGGDAQIWDFLATGADVTAAELTLVATLTGITADSLVAGDFI
jgi:hypothetical protein